MNIIENTNIEVNFDVILKPSMEKLVIIEIKQIREPFGIIIPRGIYYDRLLELAFLKSLKISNIIRDDFRESKFIHLTTEKDFDNFLEITQIVFKSEIILKMNMPVKEVKDKIFKK